MKPFCVIVLALSILGLSACGPGLQSSQSLQAKLLFSLDYGLQDRMIGLPEGMAREVELYMREGIFHVLDPVSKKILRTSSYGDLLSIIYDAEALSWPVSGQSQPIATDGAAITVAENGGRYTVFTDFIQPSRLSVDSSQRIYVADRLANPDFAVFDPMTESYYDWIIRRFGEKGLELQFIGREGILGSAFPKILSIDCLSDDSIVVMATTGLFYSVYRFSNDGMLLSSLGIDSASLPVPLELLGTNADEESVGKIHADLEGIIPMLSTSGFDVVLKLSYYREVFSSDASVLVGLEDSGSWLFSMDGRTGLQKFGFKLEPTESANKEWELLGVYKEGFLLVSQQPYAPEILGDTNSQQLESEARGMLRFVDHFGKTLYSASLHFPGAEGFLRSLRLSSTGQLYGIFLEKDKAKILWWEIPL